MRFIEDLTVKKERPVSVVGCYSNKLAKKRELKWNMGSHKPTDEAIVKIEVLREKFLTLGRRVIQDTPSSREQSLALTALEQALMYTVAAIARNETEDKK